MKDTVRALKKFEWQGFVVQTIDRKGFKYVPSVMSYCSDIPMSEDVSNVDMIFLVKRSYVRRTINSDNIFSCNRCVVQSVMDTRRMRGVAFRYLKRNNLTQCQELFRMDEGNRDTEHE